MRQRYMDTATLISELGRVLNGMVIVTSAGPSVIAGTGRGKVELSREAALDVLHALRGVGHPAPGYGLDTDGELLKRTLGVVTASGFEWLVRSGSRNAELPKPFANVISEADGDRRYPTYAATTEKALLTAATRAILDERRGQVLYFD
jgi:hypothetical protein